LFVLSGVAELMWPGDLSIERKARFVVMILILIPSS
jgi:hypothetical protein